MGKGDCAKPVRLKGVRHLFHRHLFLPRTRMSGVEDNQRLTWMHNDSRLVHHTLGILPRAKIQPKMLGHERIHGRTLACPVVMPFI